MVDLLRKLGMDCFYPEESVCCGRALYNSGDLATAKNLGEQLILNYKDVDYVVVCGSACVSYVKTQFGKLFYNSALHNSYRQFADKCWEVTDFLVNVASYRAADVVFPHSVMIMEHCATRCDYSSATHRQGTGLADVCRRLLSDVQDIRLLDMDGQDVCCGFGGSFSNHYTAISNSLAMRKIEYAVKAGAEYVVSTETSCMVHLQAVADKQGLPLRCCNVIDIVAG